MSENTKKETAKLEEKVKELEEALNVYKQGYVCKDELDNIYRMIENMMHLATEMYTEYFNRFNPLRTPHEAEKVAFGFELNRAKIDILIDGLLTVRDDLDVLKK